MLLVLSSSLTTRADQDGDRSELGKVSEQLYAALLKGDASVLERLLSDDFVGIHGNGTIETKAEYLASTRSGAFTYQKYDVRDSRVRIYGGTAVVDALVTFTGTAGGKPFTGVDLRVTRIWVRQQGGWKCVEYQVTRVAPKAGS